MESEKPPYPADTRAKGYRLELDYERINQSDTWALATSHQRPLLLMLWFVAWQQTPAGSLPNNDDLIGARIGMTSEEFAKHKETLMRGWRPAGDGRLYHKVMTEMVLEMLERKGVNAKRKADYRARMKAASTTCPTGQTQDINVTPTGLTWEHRGSDATGTCTGTMYSEAKASGGEPPDSAAFIFSVGLSMLTSTGTKEGSARSFLGKLRSQYGDDTVVAKLKECQQTNPLEPREWLAAALPPPGSKRRRPEPENFDNADYGQGVLAL